MEVTAKARHIRMSPRKVRLVADLVRGMDLSAAEAQLTYVRKAAARPVLKLLRSAKANAEHNFKLEPSSLFIKTITVDGGPVLHRWRARAHGRAAPIRKRTAHITVILDVRGLAGTAKGIDKAVVKPAAVKAAPAKKAGAKAEKKIETKEPAAKPAKHAPGSERGKGPSKKSSTSA